MSVTRERVDHLGDFDLHPRVLAIIALAIPVGAAGAGAAFCLLRLIGLITNLIFYGRVSTLLVPPAGGHRDWPIILTGGAVGSVVAQLLHMTANERKTLMVAGAAAGMAATFNAPLASILLAVELLLFEFKPRSLAPVVAAVVTATLLRGPLIGYGPIFGMSIAHLHLTTAATLECVPAGLVGGLLAIAVTRLIYASEDAFLRLPFHWMWWPPIGGLIIGIGGLIEPQALGVGYNVIDQLLTGGPRSR